MIKHKGNKYFIH